jgi:LysR family transcriptional regulator, nitrogen assimilation regulatory protein
MAAMDLRQLRYFVGIVEHGSVTRAAEALRVAQPALSLHLKRLEEEFGCQLVHRTARGVVPTESGRLLAQRATLLVEQMASLRDEVRGVEAAPSGPAVIGIPTSLGTILTVPLALAVRQRHPAIRLRAVEGLSGHMLEWVLSGLVDLALVFGVEHPPGLTTHFVARERLGLVGPKDSPLLAGRGAIDLDEALGLPLILPGRPHGVRVEVERAAASKRRTPDVVMEIDALDQIKALVAEGAGFTVLSERFARHGAVEPLLCCIPIVSPEIERTISLAHASDRPLSVAARAVRAIALGHLATLTTAGRWS